MNQNDPPSDRWRVCHEDTIWLKTERISFWVFVPKRSSKSSKTINYAIQSSIAFILFVVDTIKEIVYYQPVQEYAIANPQLLDKLSGNQKTVNIRIPKQQILSYDDRELQGLATKIYKFQEDGLPISV